MTPRRIVSLLAIAAGALPAPAYAADPLRAPASQTQLTGVTVSHGVGFTRYRQEIGGIPVLGSDGVVADGRGVQGDLVIDHTHRALTAPAPATVTRDAAIDRAARAAAGGRVSAAELAILPSGGRARLVWRVVAGSIEVLLDARSADVISAHDLLHRADGRAMIFDPNPVVEQGSAAGLADNNNADSPLLTALRVPVTLPRLASAATGCLTGTWVMAQLADAEVCIPGGDFSAVTRSDNRFEAAMAYFHIDRAQSYIQSLGFSNVMNHQLRVRVDDPTQGLIDNSVYDPTQHAITLGNGLVDDGEDADVIVHEYGHAIQDDQVPGFANTDETGAMGEGWGDYLQAAISSTFGHPGAAPCVAEWDNTPYGEPCLRRLDVPSTLAEARANPACAADVHCVGQIWSAALWDARNRIGGPAMDRIVLQHHFALTPDATFLDGAHALLAADRQLNGGANRAVLVDALVSRKLVDPERLDDTPGDAAALSVPATVAGHLDAGGDQRDVFRLALSAKRGLIVRLAAPSGDFDLRLDRGDGTQLAASVGAGGNEQFAYVPAEAGDAYLDVSAAAGAGPYTLETIADRDGDGIGDPSDHFPDDPANDADHDGRGANADNCPSVANPDQADWNHDGRGDACDRSGRVGIDAVRATRGRIVVRGRLRPATLPTAAFRARVQLRSCTRRGCSFRTVSAVRAVRRGAGGTVTATVRGLPAGRYRVRAELRSARYDTSVSAWRPLHAP